MTLRGRSPAAERVLLEDIVQTDFGQFDVVWREGYSGFGGDFGEVFGGQTNGLVGAACSDGMYVNLAHQYGGSALRVVLLDHEPAVDDAWEDVVEVSIVVPDGARPRWSTWGGERTGVLELTPGSYRVRVSARGRDQAHAHPGDADSIDAYLLHLWPSSPRPDATIKVTSDDARSWHEENCRCRHPSRH